MMHDQSLPIPEGISFRKRKIIRIRFAHIMSFLGFILLSGASLLALLVLAPSTFDTRPPSADSKAWSTAAFSPLDAKKPHGTRPEVIPPGKADDARNRTPLAEANLSVARKESSAPKDSSQSEARSKTGTAGIIARQPAMGNHYAAIIIDDVGSDMDLVKKAARLHYALTFSVLPYRTCSTKSAEFLHEKGYEILVHLPMEPIEFPQQNPGRGAVMAGMSRSAIRSAVENDIESVPFAVGVNNHMGSKATQIPAVMREVLSLVQSRKLFFVDSMTSPDSIAFETARAMNVPSFQRQIFLDHEMDVSHVERQFSAFRDLARKETVTLAIGHLHPVTLEVLRKRLPELVSDGIQIIFASNLIRYREQEEKRKDSIRYAKRTVENSR